MEANQYFPHGCHELPWHHEISAAIGCHAIPPMDMNSHGSLLKIRHDQFLPTHHCKVTKQNIMAAVPALKLLVCGTKRNLCNQDILTEGLSKNHHPNFVIPLINN